MVISISIVEQLGQLIAFEVIVCIEIPNGCFVERFAGVAGCELDRVTQVPTIPQRKVSDPRLLQPFPMRRFGAPVDLRTRLHVAVDRSHSVGAVC